MDAWVLWSAATHRATTGCAGGGSSSGQADSAVAVIFVLSSRVRAPGLVPQLPPVPYTTAF